MLRLFSSIRKTLINEGETSRYVRYAVGEVLLIMVGILLALQVQTWNQNRLLTQERRELIENLKADFRINKDRLIEITDINITKIEQFRKFLSAVSDKQNPLPVDDLKELISTARLNLGFLPVVGSYTGALSTGKINLIVESSVKELLVKFEAENLRLQELRNLNRQNEFIGANLLLRNKVGSLTALFNESFFSGEYPIVSPKDFELTKEEYRTLLAQKEVYSAFENKYEILGRAQLRLLDLKHTTEQILTALEALD